VGQIVANFRRRPNGEIVIDYEHASESPEVALGGPVPAAGWLKAIDDRADGAGILWGEAQFTDKARQMIAAGEYKYLSPYIDLAARDKETGEQQGATLTSVALTNRPFLEKLPAIALSEAGWAADAAKEETVAVTKLVLADRAACKVRAVLEDGTESVLTVEGLDPEPRVIRLSDIKRTADGRYDFAGIDAGDDVIIASEVFRAQQVQGEIQAALDAGKITAAQWPAMEKLALSDYTAFREFLKAQKPMVDLSERGFGGAGDGDDLDKVNAKLRQMVDERMKANQRLTRGGAMKLVLSEHPEMRQDLGRLMRD
jgi:phage I-like protein